MEILVGFEHNYVMPYGVMLQSLVQNNKNITIQIHAIINESVTEEDKNSLKSIVTQYNKNNSVKFYLFDKGVVDNYSLPTTKYFRESCYYRLFSSTILPASIDKVIYLDGDMVVRHDISDLWNYDIEGCAVAGVINQTETVKYHNRLHYPMSKKYINNGVAVFNLKLWREEGVEQQFVNMIKKYPERILTADQDVMNVVLQDKKKILPIKYNVQEGFYYRLEYMSFDYWGIQQEMDEAIKDPWILHYAGAHKPWVKGCGHPLKDEFFKYQNKTIWKDMPLLDEKTTWKGMLLKMVKKILAKVSIIEPERNQNLFIRL